MKQHPNGLDAQIMIQVLSASQVSLTWPSANDENRVLSYLVYQDDQLIATLPGDTMGLQVGSLLPLQSYYFKVEARDANGNESVDGPEIQVQLEDQTSPHFGVSADLTVQATSDSTVLLTWSEAIDDIGISEYYIYQDDQFIESVGSTILEFTLEGLEENSNYLFRVEAIDAAMNLSFDGPFLTYRLGDQTAPYWPEDAQIRASEIGESSVWLRWDELKMKWGFICIESNKM